MLKALKLISLVALLSVTLAQAYPKSVQAEYDLMRNGRIVGKVKESFTQDGKQYRIKSVTTGVGVYALMGERTLMSNGAVTKAGLKPAHFELRQSKKAKKNLIADFDWAKNQLNMQVKGELRTEKLTAGTQDLASYAYQFMFAPPLKDTLNITLTTGKKISQQTYKVQARDAKVAGYNTVQIANQAGADEDKKQLWLAKEQFYLPVKYELTDDEGDSFEQTLTKLSVQ